MKKLIIFLVFAVISMFFLSQKVEARNLCLDLYSEGEKVTEAVVETKTPNAAKSGDVGLNTTACKAYTVIFGAKFAGDALSTEIQALPENLKYGLLSTTYTYMYASMINPPSVDIPSTYASILLPSELRPNTDSVVYAASVAVGGGLPPNGINAISPLTDLGINKLWGISFGIAMVGFTIILVYSGFIIIFRQKVNGQTIASLGMSIQGMVMGLLFALASFAIGGFFFNLSKFLVLILAALLSTTLTYGNNAAFVPTYISSPLSLLTGNGTELFSGSDIDEIRNRTPANISTCSPNDYGCVFGEVFSGSFFPNLIQGALEAVGGILVYILVRLVGAFLLFTAAFRIFFAVFTTYTKMIMDIILAPIYFVISAIPGRSPNYSSWLKKMFRNALVLPMIFVIVNIGLYLMGLDNSSLNGGLGTSAISGITGGAIVADGSVTDFILAMAGPGYIVGLIFLLMAPSAPNLISELLAVSDSKAGGEAAKSAQSAIAGTPIIGGLFK